MINRDKAIIRAFELLIRWIVAFYNLGLSSTFKIMKYSLFGGYRDGKEATIITKKFGQIHWNTKYDLVINHFFTTQVKICSPSGKIDVKTIVDLGANIGIESIRLATLYPKAKIISVEAEKGNFQKLQKNISSYDQIEICHAAIWSENCKLKLLPAHDGNNQGWHLKTADDNEKFEMLGLTFQELIQSYKIKSIDILKVDIEGAEIKLFENNCDEWIHQVKCIIMECSDYESPLASSLIFQMLHKANYTFNTYINGENLILVRSDLDWLPKPIRFY